MSKIITTEQQKEIVKLSAEHWDALIAFGADMYRSGMIRGAICGIVGSAMGVVVGMVITEVQKKKKIAEIKETKQ